MRLIIIALIVLLGYRTLTVLQMGRFADDPGVGWHLETGRMVLRDGAAPRFDPFLGFPKPTPWVADQWLSDAILFALFDHGDWPLTYGVLTALSILTFFGLAFRIALERTGAPVLAALAAFIGLKLATVHFIWRPVIFAFILFAATTYLTTRLVTRLRRGDVIRWRDVLVWVPVFALWANIHPSFALGLIVVTITLGGTWYDLYLIDRRPPPRHAGLRCVTGVLAASLVTLLNPYGVALHHQIAGLVSSDFFMRLNTEWRPLDPTTGEGTLFLLVLGFIILAGIITPERGRLLGFADLLVLGLLSALALGSVRYLPYFAIVATPLLATALLDTARHPVFSRLPLFHRLGERCAAVCRHSAWYPRSYALGIALLTVFPIISAVTSQTVYPFRGPFGPSLERYPYGAVQHLVGLVESGEVSRPMRLAASPDWGGFITHYGHGAVIPVIDDRNSLLGVTAYERYLAGVAIGGDLTGYLSEVGAAYIALPVSSPLAIYLRDTGRGHEVYRDGVAVVFTLPDDQKVDGATHE
jgi:hypothetical protein